MARLGAVGDRLIVMAFAELEADEVEGHQPRVVALDGREPDRGADRLPAGRAAVRTGSAGSTRLTDRAVAPARSARPLGG